MGGGLTINLASKEFCEFVINLQVVPRLSQILWNRKRNNPF